MKQITIVARRDLDFLARVSQVLADRSINITSLDSENTEEHSIIVLTVEEYDEALVVLRDEGFNAVSEEAIVVRLKDEPGAVARISRRFAEAAIPLRSVRIIERSGGYGLVALSTERTREALELVEDIRVS